MVVQRIVQLMNHGMEYNFNKCFKIEFTDRNPIQNVSNISAKYQINLESLEVSGRKLLEKYLKANLKEGNV